MQVKLVYSIHDSFKFDPPYEQFNSICIIYNIRMCVFYHYKAAVYSTLLLRKEIGSDRDIDI